MSMERRWMWWSFVAEGCQKKSSDENPVGAKVLVSSNSVVDKSYRTYRL